MRWLPALALVIVSSVAHADPKPTPTESVVSRLQALLWEGKDDPTLPRAHLVLSHGAPTLDPKEHGIGSNYFALDRPVPPVVAFAIDGKSAWVASNLGAPMPKPETQPIEGHVIALFDAPDPWKPLITHAGDPSDKPFVVGPKQPAPKMPDHVDEAAADAVKRFKATIGDPAAFAKSISDRKDVVLFGSDAAERFVGGDKVRATLLRWKLVFSVRDGIQAGTTASKTVAWVAAFVDGRRADKPKAAASVYQVSAIYEKHGASWDIVQLQFSNATSP